MMELYDGTVAVVFGHLLRLTGSEQTASASTWLGYLAVWAQPTLLTDSGVPYDLQMAVIAERAMSDLPPQVHPDIAPTQPISDEGASPAGTV